MEGSFTVTGWKRRSSARVLFNGLAVLVEGGGADDLNLPPGEGGLEDVGGVHAALGVSGAHDIVNLVDHEDDVAQPS